MKNKDKHTRKLAKVGGGHTYSVTLPIGAVREFGWQEKQRVLIEVDKKNKRIIIKDYKA